MRETAAVSTNIRVRTNVVSNERFLKDPDHYRQSFSWSEIHQYISLFWQLRTEEIMQTLTNDQEFERACLLSKKMSLPDPYNSVCHAHRFLLPPFSSEPPDDDATVKMVSGNPPRDDRGVVSAVSAPIQIQNPQERVIHAASRARQLVLAPPGTGKTHTVIQRLVRLHESDRLGGDLSQVLIVSFSRAAAAELGIRFQEALRDRAAAIHTFPRLSTLDSLVGQLLFRDMGFDADLGGYDGSILLLTSILEGRKGLELQEQARQLIRGRIRIVIVDEVQDIVGIRAGLVLAILRTLRSDNPGLLILGDLRQAIYGFSLQQEQVNERKITPFQLIRDIQSEFSDLDRVEFVIQHRFSLSCQQLMTNLREAMDADKKNLPGEFPDREQLRQLLRNVPELDDPDQLFGDEFSRQRVAVLSRTNHKVSQIQVACSGPAQIYARTLRVARNPEGAGFPAWVARALGTLQVAGTLSETNFIGLYRRYVRDDIEEAKQKMEWLTDACRLDKRSFQVREVLDFIEQNSRIPTDLRDKAQPGEICLSTIHQAKGREFEVVVVVDPLSLLERSTDESNEEARILYVALTRAKNQIFRCNGRRWRPSIFMPPESPFDLSEESSTSLASSEFQNALWDCYQGMRRVFVAPSEYDGYCLEVQADGRLRGPRVTIEFLRAVSKQAGVSEQECALTRPSFQLEVGELRTKVVGKLDDRKLVLFPDFSGRLPIRI
jgi:DNA helicase-2/ATP-dependent DNA helicase PcrA